MFHHVNDNVSKNYNDNDITKDSIDIEQLNENKGKSILLYDKKNHEGFQYKG